MNIDQLIYELRRDEGVKNKVYLDTEGIETIGVGRNLRDRGLSDDEIDHLLANDISLAEADARDLVDSFDFLTDARQRVVTNMAFNLGKTRLSKFKKFLDAIEHANWERAAAEMLDSKWARQVGVRAERLADMMRAG
jgi:lysozyme